MNFDPQKFFIGLMVFFSILLPGALLTWLLVGEVVPVVLGDRYATFAGAPGWAAFLFASYLFGHLLFLLSSWLNEFYAWARRYTLNAQFALFARRSRPLFWLERTLISIASRVGVAHSKVAMHRPEFRRGADRIAVSQCQQGLVAGDQHHRLPVPRCGDQGAEHRLILCISQGGVVARLGLDQISLERERVDKVVHLVCSKPMPVRQLG